MAKTPAPKAAVTKPPKVQKKPTKPKALSPEERKRKDLEVRAKIAEAVLLGMTHDGRSLRKAAIAAGTNSSTFLLWVSEDKLLADRYAQAREALIEKIADETIELADAYVGTTDNGSTDSGAVAKQRLQVDTRKWLLSKLAPKKYGDKVEQTVLGHDGGPLQVKTITINGK